MTTQQLESFIQVAENLSFARASELLNITQSAVSRQIRSLEDELDTQLFRRTTRTVSLTPGGAIFLEHAKRILEQLKLAEAKLRYRTDARVQTLTIGCESEGDLDAAGAALAACRAEMPTFHPFVKVGAHRALLELFFQRELQALFGFRENLPVKAELAFQELRQLPLCCVLPAGHPDGARTQLSEEALYGRELILCGSYAIPSGAAELQNRVAQHVPPERVHVSEDLRAIPTLVRAGYGCAILPPVSARESGVVCVPIRNTPPLSYGVIYHKDSADPVLRRFLDITLRVAEEGWERA